MQTFIIMFYQLTYELFLKGKSEKAASNLWYLYCDLFPQDDPQFLKHIIVTLFRKCITMLRILMRCFLSLKEFLLFTDVDMWEI